MSPELATRPRDAARTERLQRLALALTVLLGACEGDGPTAVDRPLAPKPGDGSPTPEVEPEPAAMIGVLAPAAEVVLVAPGFGRIEQLTLDLGDRVGEGELIATMNLRGERSELASATAAWKAAQAELERLGLELDQARANRTDVEQLENFVSAAELRERRFAEELAAARKRSAGASLSEQRSKVAAASERLAESELRAPFAAVIAHRYVDPGATLASGEPIVELLSEQRLVRFAVPEQAAGGLRLGAAVRVRFADAELELPGKVSAIAPEIEPGTRLLFAEAEFAGDSSALRIGAVAQVRFVDPSASTR